MHVVYTMDTVTVSGNDSMLQLCALHTLLCNMSTMF